MDLNKLNAAVANNLSTIAAQSIEDKAISKAQKVHPKYLKRALRLIWNRVSLGENDALYNGFTNLHIAKYWSRSWNERVAQYVKYSLENMGFKVDIVVSSVPCDFNAFHVPALKIKW